MAWRLAVPSVCCLVIGNRIIALRGFNQRSGAEFRSPFVVAAALYYAQNGGDLSWKM